MTSGYVRRAIGSLMRGLCLAACLLSFVGGARADFQTGAKLQQACAKSGDAVALAYCLGYIAAIADAIGNGDEEISYWDACIPTGTTQGEIFDKMQAWLAEHPQNAEIAASDNIAQGLAAVYPCN